MQKHKSRVDNFNINPLDKGRIPPMCTVFWYPETYQVQGQIIDLKITSWSYIPISTAYHA